MWVWRPTQSAAAKVTWSMRPDGAERSNSMPLLTTSATNVDAAVMAFNSPRNDHESLAVPPWALVGLDNFSRLSTSGPRLSV